MDTSALIDLVYSNPRSAPAWKGILSRVETGNLVLVSSSLLAASIRRDYGLKTPDAVHLATAVGSGCEAFLSADNDFSRVTGYPLPLAPSRSLKVILVQDAT